MGSHAYFYFTHYQADVNSALQALRQQEFEAGRYDPAVNMHDSEMYMFLFDFRRLNQLLRGRDTLRLRQR